MTFMDNGGTSCGGERGIRTLEGLAPLTVFETAPFNHSGTSPSGVKNLTLKAAEVSRVERCVQALETLLNGSSF